MLVAFKTGPVHMSASPLLTSAGPFCRRSSTAAAAVALAHNSATDHVAATFILLGLSVRYWGGAVRVEFGCRLGNGTDVLEHCHPTTLMIVVSVYL
jgi:hypothetical protein